MYIIIGVSAVVLAVISYFFYRWWSNRGKTPPLPLPNNENPSQTSKPNELLDADAAFIKGKNKNKSTSKSKSSSSSSSSSSDEKNTPNKKTENLKSPLSLMPSPTSNSYRMNYPEKNNIVLSPSVDI
jgi:cytoskeletal protein RodZ